MSTVHELKTVGGFFQAVSNGRKTFEVRKDDRDFLEGDFLHLREWSPVVGDWGDPTEYEYTTRELMVEVTYVLRPRHFPEGVPAGYVVMGIRVLS